MQMNYTVNQMVDRAILHYDLPDKANDNKAYREKIVRTLKNQGLWDDTKKRGNVFDEDTVRKILYNVLKTYFEKRSGAKYAKRIQMEEKQLEQYSNTEEYYDDDGEIHENEIPRYYFERKRDLMLEALFNKFFILDEKKYKRDMLLRC